MPEEIMPNERVCNISVFGNSPWLSHGKYIDKWLNHHSFSKFLFVLNLLYFCPDVVVHAFYLRTQETEAGGSL